MKKILSLVLVLVMMAGLLLTPAFAAPKVPDAVPEIGAKTAVILDAGFHCNTGGGNGRVWVSAYDNKYEADKALKKNGVGGVLEDLIYLGDNSWLLADTVSYVCPKCGSSIWVSYSNKSGVPDGKNIQLTHGTLPDVGFDGSFSLLKTIDGGLVGSWELNGISILDIVDDISFNVYKANLDGDSKPDGYDDSKIISIGKFDATGLITFDYDERLEGWYAIVESFTPNSLAETIFEDVGPLYMFFVDGSAILSSTGVVYNFDYGATYTGLENRSGRFAAGYTLTAAGQAKLDNYLAKGGNPYEASLANPNPWFGDFYVRDAAGNLYPSFCGDWFSGYLDKPYDGHDESRFAGDAAAAKANILAALNYINDTWGGIDAWPVGNGTPADGTKLIAQLAIWVLLDDGIAAIEAVSDAAYLNAYVQEVIEAARNGYVSENKTNFIYDIAFLTNSALYDNRDEGTGFIFSQAQIVPIFASEETTEITFDNRTTTGGYDGTMQAVFEIEGTRNVIEYGYEPNTSAINDTLVTFGGEMDGRGFTINEVSIADGGEFEIAKSGHGNPKFQDENDKTGLTYSVEVVGDEIVITFDEKYVSSQLTVKAYIECPDGNFDNSKHVSNDTGVVTLPLPAGAEDTVWLFFHSEKFTYYDGTYTRYTVGEDVEAVDYTGTLTLAVTNEAGDLVYEVIGTLDELDFDAFGFLTIPGTFTAGKYFATLSGDDFEPIDSEGEIVDNGDVITFDFGWVAVTYPDRIIDPGYPNA